MNKVLKVINRFVRKDNFSKYLTLRFVARSGIHIYENKEAPEKKYGEK